MTWQEKKIRQKISSNEFEFQIRVARFFLVQHTKPGKNIPNVHKIYQILIKYPKCS
jgi:hypothetical protein